MDRYTIERALHNLQSEIVEILFETTSREHESAIRLRSFDANCESRLSMLGSFDSLVATVLLAVMSEEIASPELRETSLRIYRHIQPQLKEKPEIAPFYPELFSLIDLRCKQWAILSQNQRMDVVVFWQGVENQEW